MEAAGMARRWIGTLALVVGSSCGGGAGPAPAAQTSPSPGAEPPGYVRVEVADVNGEGVVLLEPGTKRYLPIFVADDQALAMTLRLNKQSFRRPLTHDLLDRIVDRLGGSVVWVQIVRLEGTTFIGSVTLREDGRVFSVDARSSDAIIIALGRRVPIYVAAGLLQAQAVPLDSPIRSGIPECDRVLTRFLRCVDAEWPLVERVALYSRAHAHARALRESAGGEAERTRGRDNCLAQERQLEAQLGKQACWGTSTVP
jgi:uncharacterized protein